MTSLLVVADGSRQSEAALQSVVDLVRRGEWRTVHLLSVQPRIDGYGTGFVGRNVVRRFLQERAEAELRAARKILDDAGVHYRVHVRTGGVVETVARAAADLRVNEIVLGADSSTLAGIFDFYTVAARIIRRVSVPVSVVKIAARPAGAAGPAAGWQFRPSA